MRAQLLDDELAQSLGVREIASGAAALERAEQKEGPESAVAALLLPPDGLPR